jgi:hypothetical protein
MNQDRIIEQLDKMVISGDMSQAEADANLVRLRSGEWNWPTPRAFELDSPSIGLGITEGARLTDADALVNEVS